MPTTPALALHSRQRVWLEPVLSTVLSTDPPYLLRLYLDAPQHQTLASSLARVGGLAIETGEGRGEDWSTVRVTMLTLTPNEHDHTPNRKCDPARQQALQTLRTFDIYEYLTKFEYEHLRSEGKRDRHQSLILLQDRKSQRLFLGYSP